MHAALHDLQVRIGDTPPTTGLTGDSVIQANTLCATYVGPASSGQVLALSTQGRMFLYGLDVTGAFLNTDRGETEYIELPDRLRPRIA